MFSDEVIFNVTVSPTLAKLLLALELDKDCEVIVGTVLSKATDELALDVPLFPA